MSTIAGEYPQCHDAAKSHLLESVRSSRARKASRSRRIGSQIVPLKSVSQSDTILHMVIWNENGRTSAASLLVVAISLARYCSCPLHFLRKICMRELDYFIPMKVIPLDNETTLMKQERQPP